MLFYPLLIDPTAVKLLADYENQIEIDPQNFLYLLYHSSCDIVLAIAHRHTGPAVDERIKDR